MQEYVIVYAAPIVSSEYVLVVLKDRPSNQRGKYNLPGGKIEFGETPIQAAIRELKEETGIVPQGPVDVVGKITGSWGIVHCVKVPVLEVEPIPRDGETEEPKWIPWRILKKSNLMPNLKVIVPMLRDGLSDWVIVDEFGTSEDKHTFQITVGI